MAAELEHYLEEVSAIRASGAGVPETSFYSALSRLFNEVGKTLRPKVRCVMTLANRGAGLPDGGFFTAEQFRRTIDEEPLKGQIPSRGVIEAKPVRDDVWKIAKSEQVLRYWKRHGLVLVTNFRDFLLVGKDRFGEQVTLESYRLASSEKDFWRVAAQPHATAKEIGVSLVDFLKRVMLHAAPLENPKDVAWFLSSYAREAKARVEKPKEIEALAAVRSALEESLGLHFRGPKGEHFFRSTFVQTLFYGIFSGWVLWCKERKANERFDWRQAEWSLRVPIIRALFEQVASPGKLEPLGLVEVLDWAGATLDRVVEERFFAQFNEGEAVQYFYEPFLAAFDPELRKDLGVWFTPPEIVRYMVARVDTVLQQELGLADGLADPRVVVLDPACGTGAYLVEVLRAIERRLSGRVRDGLSGQDLKSAAMKRIFGFEILPAPFVVAHLQVGLLLQNLGTPLSGEHGERAAIYLTNALTGWSAEGKKQKLPFPELEEERDAAEHVKQKEKILVVIGNPPYNAFAGTSPDEEQGLVEPYKKGLAKEWGIKKFNLDDLYVRFFRLAERRIAEQEPRLGIVSFISNYSWVNEPSFVVMRKHLLDNFDRFWIDNMHGNRKISEYAPDGRTSETIFAIPGFSPGIQQGTVISVWAKSGRDSQQNRVLYRDDLNAARAEQRRAQLLQSLSSSEFDAQYESASPLKENRYSFRPTTLESDYASWPSVLDLCAKPPSNGLMEKRGGALVDIDREAVADRLRAYLDGSVAFEDLRAIVPGLATDAARFSAQKARRKVLSAESFEPSRIVRYSVRPFDTRYAYYSGVRPLWNEPRPALWKQAWDGNRFVLTRFRSTKPDEGIPFYFTRFLSDDHLLTPDAVAIPFFLRGEGGLFESATVNLSPAVKRYLNTFGIPASDPAAADLIWYHVLAVGHSPAYLTDNRDAIRSDWPRIPLPSSREALESSAALGARVAALLDVDTPLTGVTAGDVRAELSRLAIIGRSDELALRPEEGDLDVTVGWGHEGKERATMPGKGKLVERQYSSEEIESLKAGAARLGVSLEELLSCLGERTCDVYLNKRVFWRNVPAQVWSFTVGGYQVVKKWLSYREHSILHRSITVNEARELAAMVHRIAALLILQNALDENFRSVSASAAVA